MGVKSSQLLLLASDEFHLNNKQFMSVPTLLFCGFAIYKSDTKGVNLQL